MNSKKLSAYNKKKTSQVSEKPKPPVKVIEKKVVKLVLDELNE